MSVIGSMHERRPNWLLRGMIGLSLAVHLVLFVHLASVYRSKAVSHIEFEMEEILPPRSMPQPPPDSSPPPPRIEAPPPRMIEAVPTPAPSIPDVGAPSVPTVPRISAPTTAPISRTDIVAWTGETDRKPAATYASPRDYLAMVQRRIEEFKHYPKTARDRQLEGEATVRFVLTRAGALQEVQLLRSSGHALLDEAAVRAIHDAAPFPTPPDGLFAEDISVQVTLVFRLT